MTQNRLKVELVDYNVPKSLVKYSHLSLDIPLCKTCKAEYKLAEDGEVSEDGKDFEFLNSDNLGIRQGDLQLMKKQGGFLFVWGDTPPQLNPSATKKVEKELKSSAGNLESSLERFYSSNKSRVPKDSTVYKDFVMSSSSGLNKQIFFKVDRKAVFIKRHASTESEGNRYYYYMVLSVDK